MTNLRNENTGQMNYAVLTGDIVNSSSLKDDRRYQMYQDMQQLSGLLKQVFVKEIRYDLSNFRGDGWQLILDQPERSLAVSIFIRTYFRYKYKEEKLDSRVAIAVGPVDYIPRENISEGFGPAFDASGRLLDEMKSEKTNIVVSHTWKIQYQKMINALVRTMDDLISSWTAPQSQAIHLALQGLTQTESGERWKPKPITQPSVARHLKSAQWGFVKNAIELFEVTMSMMMNSEIEG